MYETFGLIVALVVTVISLNTAFGRFIAGSKRYWLLLALFFLFNNLTNYYWVEYNLVMHGYPTISNYFTYLGWNISFVILAILIRTLQGEEERLLLWEQDDLSRHRYQQLERDLQDGDDPFPEQGLRTGCGAVC